MVCRRHLGPGHRAAGARVWRLRGAEHQLQHAGQRRLAGRPAGAHRPPADRPAARGTRQSACCSKQSTSGDANIKTQDGWRAPSPELGCPARLQNPTALLLSVKHLHRHLASRGDQSKVLRCCFGERAQIACLHPCRHTPSGTSAGKGCCHLLWRKCCAPCCMRTPRSGSQHGSCCSTRGCKLTNSTGGCDAQMSKTVSGQSCLALMGHPYSLMAETASPHAEQCEQARPMCRWRKRAGSLVKSGNSASYCLHL